MSANPEPEKKEVDPWIEYERRKAQLPNDLSPKERDAETRKIANELGI